MPEVHPASPDTAYLTKDNIIHPRSGDAAAVVTDAEARARVELGIRLGVTVTGGSIETGN